MQQVPATKDSYPVQRASINQFADTFNEQIGVDLKKNDLIIHTWSLYAAPILDNYYLEDRSVDIDEYISTLKIKEITSKTGEKPYLIWQKMYSEIDNNAKLCGLDTWKLLGDPHQSPHNKYKSANFVYQVQEDDHQYFIRGIIEKFFPHLSDSVPIYSTAGHIYKRNYLPITQENISDKDIMHFYFLMGSFIAFSIAFRMYDVHAENIMVKKNRYPYFYDLECLFLPALKEERYNIEFTGFVKLRSVNDYSILSGGKKNATSFFTPIYIGTKKRPKIKWDIKYEHEFMNTPKLGEERIYSDRYKQDIIDGYIYFAELFNKQKSEIIDHTVDKEIGTRLVLRLTRFYTRLLRESNFTITLKNYGKREDYFTEMLSDPDFELSIDSLNSEKLIHLEKKILKKNLIPVYRSVCNKRDIFLNGETVGVLSETQIDTWENHLKGDIFTEGLQYIKALSN